MRPDLRALVDQQSAAITPAGAWPAPSPAPGQDRAQWLDSVAQLRQQHDAMALEATRLLPPFPGVGSLEAAAPVPSAAPEAWFEAVPVGSTWRSVKVYRPAAAGARERAGRPALLVLHGGGWWMGGGATAFEIGDPLCRRLVDGLGAVVVSLDYRLAPEHRFPAGLVDAEAAVRWMHAEADRLGIDPARIGVLGSSAGGNLAAAVVRRLRRTTYALALQALHVPALDLRFNSGRASARDWEEEGRRLRAYYLDDDNDVHDPEVSPVLAREYLDLPPAVVVVGTHDPLRDEGAAYHGRLLEAGVPSTCLEHEMTHGIATPDVARAWLDGMIAECRRILVDPAVRVTTPTELEETTCPGPR